MTALPPTSDALNWAVPSSPRGDSTKGNYELTYTATAGFVFGGAISMGNWPPPVVQGMTFVLVSSPPAYSMPFVPR